MKKQFVACLLLVACILSLTSCFLVPMYNSPELIEMLENKGYAITDVDEEAQEGIVGYIYGYNEETEDEIYYIYCENIFSASSVYNYVHSKQKAKKAEIKMEIEKVEYALYKAEGISAAEKGDYYERYVELTEELDEIERYSCGYSGNVVWYGTKQAVSDIKQG